VRLILNRWASASTRAEQRGVLRGNQPNNSDPKGAPIPEDDAWPTHRDAYFLK